MIEEGFEKLRRFNAEVFRLCCAALYLVKSMFYIVRGYVCFSHPPSDDLLEQILLHHEDILVISTSTSALVPTIPTPFTVSMLMPVSCCPYAMPLS